MTSLESPGLATKEAGPPTNGEGAPLGAEGSSDLADNNGSQEPYVPELRIMEVIRTLGSPPEHEKVTPTVMSPQNEEHKSTTSPKNGSVSEQRGGPSLPQRQNTSKSQQMQRKTSLKRTTSLAGPPRKARKRAYQKLEEEAASILNGWDPPALASSAGTRILSAKLKQKPENWKSTKTLKRKTKSLRPPMRASKAPMATGSECPVVETWDALPKTRIEASTVPKRIRRQEYEDFSSLSEEGNKTVRTTVKARGRPAKQLRRGKHLAAQSKKAPSRKSTQPVSGNLNPPTEKKGDHVRKHRTVVGGRSGVIGARRSARAASSAAAQGLEVTKGGKKIRAPTRQPTSKLGRPRGRPRKRVIKKSK